VGSSFFHWIFIQRCDTGQSIAAPPDAEFRFCTHSKVADSLVNNAAAGSKFEAGHNDSSERSTCVITSFYSAPNAKSVTT